MKTVISSVFLFSNAGKFKTNTTLVYIINCLQSKLAQAALAIIVVVFARLHYPRANIPQYGPGAWLLRRYYFSQKPELQVTERISNLFRH